jgi:hypothetical protein
MKGVSIVRKCRRVQSGRGIPHVASADLDLALAGVYGDTVAGAPRELSAAIAMSGACANRIGRSGHRDLGGWARPMRATRPPTPATETQTEIATGE